VSGQFSFPFVLVTVSSFEQVSCKILPVLCNAYKIGSGTAGFEIIENDLVDHVFMAFLTIPGTVFRT
jgi:hypothetical protein